MKGFLNIVRADIRRGIGIRWKFLIFVFIVAFVFASQYFMNLNSIIKHGFVAVDNTFGDVFLYYFRGIEEYIQGSDQPIEIPIQYFVTNLLALYYVAYYPSQEMQGIGKNILLNSDSRVKWWFSKCIWNVTAVTVVFLTELTAITICSCIFSNDTFSWSLVPTNELTDYFYMSDTVGKNIVGLALTMIFGTYVARLAITGFQLVCAYIFKPIFGFMISMVTLIYSVYEMAWCMPGNFMMTYRNVLINANGVDLNSALSFGAIMLIVMVVAGGVYSHRKDYF